ncbi:major facilitator superfamily domain-containing protein [Xylaria sp. CBS 124048]|nr:major facilitator superfamily domain-containing protein [Xylaria sp. CBS 124048]
MAQGEARRHDESSDETDENSELTCLLPQSPQPEQRRAASSPISSWTWSSAPSAYVRKVPESSYVITILYAIVFLASFSGAFIELPLVRLIEDAICQDYYDVGSSSLPIDESDCKEDAIQKQLAYLLAVQSTLSSIVAFVATLPWGLAADKIGRKPIVAIAMFGLLVGSLIEMAVIYWRNVFPITAIWISSSSQLIGGGNGMLVAVVLSMVADATSEEGRAIAFLRIHVASLSGNLSSPSLAGFVMQRSGPWTPQLIGVGFFLVGGILFFFLTETLEQKELSRETRNPEPSSLRSVISRIGHQFLDSLSILTSPSLILLLVAALGSIPVMDSTLQFLNQFISKRYHIKIAQTGYVQTMYGVASIVMTLFILPWISGLVINPATPARYRAKNEHCRDLSLARWSYVILFFGSLTLGLSMTLGGFVFGLFLMALGSGFGSLSKSLMSIYVDPAHWSRLFSIVGMIEMVGSIFSLPLLAGLFTLGLEWHGVWIGLPYLGLAVLIAVTGSLLIFVRVPRQDGDSMVPGDYEEA